MENFNTAVLTMMKNHRMPDKRKEVEEIFERWNATGILEGLNRTVATNLAILLENQGKELYTRHINENVSVSDIAGFNKIAFPLIRRVFAKLLTNEIVSVQPMTVPSGLVFFLDFQYERTKSGVTAGDSLYGQRDTPISGKAGGIGANTALGAMYNYNALGYSQRTFLVGTTTPTSTSLTAVSNTVTGTLSGFNFTLDTPKSVDVMAYYAFRPAASGQMTAETGTYSTFRSLTAIKSLTADSYSPTIDVMLTQSTSSVVTVYSNTNLAKASLSGVDQVTLLGRAETLVQDATANPATTNTGDFENTAEIPQINMKILSTVVTAQTKKLKASWSPELTQDLNAYMAMDAEAELTNALSEQIAFETDREVIADLFGVAAVRAAWSRKIGRYVYFDKSTKTVKDATSANVTFSNQAFYGTQDDWHQTLGHVALAVSNNIYKRNLRFGANWMICGMQAATIIESMAKMFTASEGEEKFSLGIEKMGSFGGRWTAYKDPYCPEDQILMGFKGSSQLEAGYIWAPYIPLIVTPTIFSPDNLNPVKGALTRNAKTTIRPDFYGRISLLDIGSYIAFSPM